MANVKRETYVPVPQFNTHSITLTDLSIRDLRILRALMNEATSKIVSDTAYSRFPVSEAKGCCEKDIQYRIFNVVDDMLRDHKNDKVDY